MVEDFSLEDDLLPEDDIDFDLEGMLEGEVEEDLLDEET